MGFFYKIILCTLLIFTLWVSGLIWFVEQIPTTLSDDQTPADAIVVLTGGKNRLEYAFQLLSEGKGKKLFISGVHENITIENLIIHNSPPEVRVKLQEMYVQDPGIIVLDREAENTIGNAEETARWLESEHFGSIRLVTSNYHMPRSLEEFSDIMGDFEIFPSPVLPEDFTLRSWWLIPYDRDLVFSEYHKYIASVVRHWVLSYTNPPPTT